MAMGFGGLEEEKLTLAKMKYSMAKEFGELVGRFARDLRKGKEIGWERFETALRWFTDPENTENWTLCLQLCHDSGTAGIEKVSIEGESAVTVDMRPWKNKSIWQPFIKMLYTDLTLKFKESGDMLSLLGFMTGFGLKDRKPELPATDLKKYFSSLMDKR